MFISKLVAVLETNHHFIAIQKSVVFLLISLYMYPWIALLCLWICRGVSMSWLKQWSVIALSSMACGRMQIFFLRGKVPPAVLILFLCTSLLNWKGFGMDSLAFHVLRWVQVCYNQSFHLLFTSLQFSLSVYVFVILVLNELCGASFNPVLYVILKKRWDTNEL